MTRDTRIALFLIGELVAALRDNDSDLFRQWLAGGSFGVLESGVELASGGVLFTPFTPRFSL